MSKRVLESNNVDDVDIKKSKLKSNKIIGYANKHNYIITLEIPENAKTNFDRKDIVNRDCALFTTNIAKISNMTTMIGHECDSMYIYGFKTPINVGETYEINFDFYLKKEIAMLIETHNGEVKRYYPNGRLKEEFTRVNQKIDGVYKAYHDNQNNSLAEEAFYIEGKENGTNTKFHENKVIAERTTMINGVRNGIRECFDKNGQLLFKNTYCDNKPIYY
jgi:hypothetical protein